MASAVHTGIACTHWVAKIRPSAGRDVTVHIHRGAPIPVEDALRIARKTAPFGKVASIDPLARCMPYVEEDC